MPLGPDTYRTAYLTFLGEKQAKIAEIIGCKQPQVARHLRLARENQLLELRLVEEAFPQDLLGELKRLYGGKELADTLESRLRSFGSGRSKHRTNLLSVHVINLNHDVEAPDIDSGFLKAASRRVFHLLADARHVGVAWGTTLRDLVEKGDLSRARAGALSVSPICGDLHYLEDFDPLSASTTLAARIAGALHASGKAVNLTRVDAFCDFDAGLPEDVYRENRHYREMFIGSDDKPARIKRIDTVLTGLGSVGNPLGRGREELKRRYDLSDDDIRTLFLGDIGGVLLVDLDGPHLGLARRIARQWTGIRESTLARIARNAAKADAQPGVIALACGASKGPVILEAVTRGLVNHLVIDLSAAQELDKASSSQGPAP